MVVFGQYSDTFLVRLGCLKPSIAAKESKYYLDCESVPHDTILLS